MPSYARRRLASALALVAVGALWAAPAGAAQTKTRPAGRSAAVPKIPYERYTLPNGLTVILIEDHAVPLTALSVWYHVGSKNEKVGRTGFAHLFEHVMFQGSEHVPNDAHFKTIEEAGG